MRSMLWECEVTGPLQQWWPLFQSPWLGFWSTSRCISAKGYQNAEAAFRNAEFVDGLPSQPRAPSPELRQLRCFDIEFPAQEYSMKGGMCGVKEQVSEQEKVECRTTP
jgi:hypothetical protein